MLAQHSAVAFEQASKSIFRIEAKRGSSSGIGTGFAVARLAGSKRLVLATARHIVELWTIDRIEWIVQQFDRNGRPTREVRFSTDPHDKDSPIFLHKKMDAGILLVASHNSDGHQFSPDDEIPLRMIDERRGVAAGTRVGWAGFPLVAQGLLGHAQLCYCEGVISATIDRDDKRYYLVDGQNTFGISGGPVWHWSESNGFEVVGIVSGYTPPSDLPGFCLVEPLDSFRALFKLWQEWGKKPTEPAPSN